MLARLTHIEWSAAPVPTCDKWVPYQLAIYATVQWTNHCSQTSGGIIEESFFYVFGRPLRPTLLRTDLRPVDESPELNSELERILKQKLAERYGAPTQEPEMFEIGFQRLRHGQPVAGEHWHGGNLHYFLHHNQSNQLPMGMRHGVELIVFENRLFEERAKDDFIQQVDGFGGVPGEDDALSTPLKQVLGEPYLQVLNSRWTSEAERKTVAAETWRQTLDLLTRASAAPGETKALLWLAADQYIVKLSGLLAVTNNEGQQEAANASSVRRQLASFGVKLGGMTHNAGLAYENDLVWRVWRELPDTEAGEMAFVQLQQRGWNTSSGIGCPPNPDLFHEVIDKGEAFLAQHPHTKFRKEILFTLAVANESWWSIARAPKDDAIVSAPPYPRKFSNKKDAGLARERAIQYYRELIQLAPDSPEAASAVRRLPRLELGLDTGQRRFFCFYC